MVSRQAPYAAVSGGFPLQLEEQISDWLLKEAGGNRIEYFQEETVCLATSQGLAHERNEDRVAFLEVRQQTNGHSPIAALIVADGISGMADAGRAASLAIAAFATSMLYDREAAGLKRLLVGAIRHANDAVFQQLGGRGGTTVSAIIYSNQGAVGVNVGDSRIYSFNGSSLRLLTIDDTLGEHLRLHRGGPKPSAADPRLVQFVGIGSDLEPHLIELESFGSTLKTTYLLTTDGAHSVGDANLEAILKANETPTIAALRVIEAARALGSTDDATVSSLPKQLALRFPAHSLSLRIRTPGRELSILAQPMLQNRAASPLASDNQPELFAEHAPLKDQERKRPRKKRQDSTTPAKGKKTPKRGTARNKRTKRQAPIIQLIEGDAADDKQE